MLIRRFFFYPLYKRPVEIAIANISVGDTANTTCSAVLILMCGQDKHSNLHLGFYALRLEKPHGRTVSCLIDSHDALEIKNFIFCYVVHAHHHIA